MNNVEVTRNMCNLHAFDRFRSESTLQNAHVATETASRILHNESMEGKSSRFRSWS